MTDVMSEIAEKYTNATGKKLSSEKEQYIAEMLDVGTHKANEERKGTWR